MVTDKDRIEGLVQDLATLKMKYAEAMTMLAWYDTIASKVPLNSGKLKVIGLEHWVDRMLTNPQSLQGVTWTTEKPTQTGWYWYRGAHFIERNALVQIVPKEGEHESSVEMWHIASEAGHPLPDGEWAGPLEPPQ